MIKIEFTEKTVQMNTDEHWLILEEIDMQYDYSGKQCQFSFDSIF